ncbi:ferritin-like domain-containing protein [Albirhodobacter sp. R86504]|uniref:YciE/YciF ferroxidase family protein n=1 Tax=Albirhodobacter sp. R86504 TaxID=3093848 RepID=UPI00366A9C13
MATSNSAKSTAKTDDTKSKPAAKSKTSRGGKTRTVSKSKPDATARSKRANTVARKTSTKAKSSAKANKSEEKGLADLLEHGVKDIYYAEKKIYRALPKMIKAADDEQLVEALTEHREETSGQIETLEKVFEEMGLKAKGEKCEAIDGILAESDSILDDFGGTFAGDAAIIFSCQAVEHYEIARYTSMVGFADALGLDKVRDMLKEILDQESSAHTKLDDLADGSINEAASEYDEDDDESDTASSTKS